MSLSIDNNELRTQVLNKSCYFTPKEKDPRSEDQLELVTLQDSFDIDLIKDAIEKSSTLGGFDKPLITEVLETLYQNRDKFGLDKQDNIGFYFNGKPLLRVRIENLECTNEIFHISLQKYRSLKHEFVTDRKFNRIIYMGLGTTFLMTGLFFGMSFFRSRSQ